MKTPIVQIINLSPLDPPSRDGKGPEERRRGSKGVGTVSFPDSMHCFFSARRKNLRSTKLDGGAFQKAPH